MSANALLTIEGLVKRYPGTIALDHADLEVHRGEVHALLGGNGSGKSTLIKILAGVEQADQGHVRLGERDLEASDLTPETAQRANLRFVHQQGTTFAELTVAENLALGYGFPGLTVKVDWRRLRARARATLTRFDCDIDVDAPVALLSAADRARVAICRALQDVENAGSGLLVLDEPTTSLGAREVALLLSTLRRLAQHGWTILYVTHRLDEVRAVADTVSVLRDGRCVTTRTIHGLEHDDLVELIAGRQIERFYPDSQRSPGHPQAGLSVRGLKTAKLRDVDLDVGRGEIVGLAGLLGAGASEILDALWGVVPARAELVQVGGEAVRLGSPVRAKRAGMAYLPADRSSLAAFSDLSVCGNLSVTAMERYWRGWRLDRGAERRDTDELVRRFGIRCGSDEAPLSTLSGGNQQKVVLARWLRLEPIILLLDEPTQGVDVGSRADIYAILREGVGRGVSVLMSSSDADELAHLCDRVMVVVDGQIADTVVGDELTPERITAATYLEAAA